MEVDVYVDLLFLINAAMDMLCLCLTAKLLHRKLSPLRIGAAGILGGVYAVISLFFSPGWVISIGMDLLVCVLLCAVAFGDEKKWGRGLIRLTLVYLLLSLALGGIMTALYSLFNRLGMDRILQTLTADEDGGSGDSLEGWIFGLIALLGGALTLWGGRFLRGGELSGACRVTVCWGERRVTLEGMVDTGNLLRDPMSGKPVICVHAEAVADLLPSTLWDTLTQGGDPTRLEPRAARRLRVIPLMTATGEGLLYGFLPDGVTLNTGKEDTPVEAVIALTSLSKTQALVPGELCR